jgi:2',3'-cyclic-nucleotide 2'-phosphodiesterase (5'-nucleotidase family)
MEMTRRSVWITLIAVAGLTLALVGSPAVGQNPSSGGGGEQARGHGNASPACHGLDRAAERVTNPRARQAISEAQARRAARAEPVEVTILHDTHFHGNFHDSRVGSDGASISQYMGLVRELYEAAPNPLFLGAGDDLASSVESSVFRGEHMIDAFNASVLDYNTYGNHEFDYGPDNVAELVAKSDFGWLSANVRDAHDPDRVFGEEAGARMYALEEIDGVTVGLTGVGPRGMATLTSLGDDVVQLDAEEVLPGIIAEMRAACADIIVVMNHLSNPHAIELAEAVDGIDVIVGGHSHATPREPIVISAGETDTLFSYVGYEFTNVGELTLQVTSSGIDSYDFVLHALDPDQAPDPAVQEVQDGYEEQLEAELDVPIGQVAETWGTRTPEAEGLNTRDRANGNFIADAMRRDVDADVALTNRGGTRSDFTPGQELTRRDIITMMPFGNIVMKIELSGQDLLDALEYGVSGEAGGGYPEVSGLTMTYDTSRAPYDRITSLEIGGEPVDVDATYTMAVANFLFHGGDGYDMLADHDVLIGENEGRTRAEAATEMVLDLDGEVDWRIEGRIVRE